MLQALLHGKLSRDQENMEDILTSNIFGLLRYVPANVGLLPLLSLAEGTDGCSPLAWLRNTDNVKVTPGDYIFWPFWAETDSKPCEPDVVIRVHAPENRKLLILVEAKFKSGKSSNANQVEEHPNDQLAREWDNLQYMAKMEEAEPFLIYLTASIGFPASDIHRSIAEYRQKRSKDSRTPQILALSWRQVPEIFGESPDPILKDLCSLCERLGLLFFHGARIPRLERPRIWRFNPFPNRWIHPTEPPSIKWRFIA